MSRIVSGLERAGLLKRHATEDGRRVRLVATAKGTKILREGRRRRVESLANALESLAETDRARLRELAELLPEIVRKI
jgi:DNA-binding MarR family transcriptional regulator